MDDLTTPTQGVWNGTKLLFIINITYKIFPQQKGARPLNSKKFHCCDFGGGVNVGWVGWGRRMNGGWVGREGEEGEWWVGEEGG